MKSTVSQRVMKNKPQKKTVMTNDDLKKKYRVDIQVRDGFTSEEIDSACYRLNDEQSIERGELPVHVAQLLFEQAMMTCPDKGLPFIKLKPGFILARVGAGLWQIRKFYAFHSVEEKSSAVTQSGSETDQCSDQRSSLIVKQIIIDDRIEHARKIRSFVQQLRDTHRTIVRVTLKGSAYNRYRYYYFKNSKVMRVASRDPILLYMC